MATGAKRRPPRAGNGAPTLVQRGAHWSIGWPKGMREEFGLPPREATGQADRIAAEQILRRRMAEIYSDNGDERRAAEARKGIAVPPLPNLIASFLEAYEAGTPRKKPRPNTVARVEACLVGPQGLAAFAERRGENRLSARLITEWLLHHENASADTRRLMGISGKQLAKFAEREGVISPAVLRAILAVPVARAAESRVRRQGRPTVTQALLLVDTLSPEIWQLPARVQLATGLRLGEVMALRVNWIDRGRRSLTVRSDSGFTTKSGKSRTLPGLTDPALALLEALADAIERGGLTYHGYRLALRRAVAKLRAAEKWPFSSVSHAFRQTFASELIMAGATTYQAQSALGHADPKTTLGYIEAHGVETPFIGASPSRPGHALRLVAAAE